MSRPAPRTARYALRATALAAALGLWQLLTSLDIDLWLRRTDARPGSVVAPYLARKAFTSVDLRLAWRLRIVDPRTIREEHIEPSIIVVVHHCHPTTHRLEQILARCGGARVRERDADRLCHVGEGDVG